MVSPSIHMLTLILLYADHNLLSPNLTQIANEFGMSEQERDTKIGGQFSLAFYLLGVPSSLLFGWISDGQRIAILSLPWWWL